MNKEQFLDVEGLILSLFYKQIILNVYDNGKIWGI